MNSRHLLMIAGVAIAGWLALFGDKTPESEIAEPLPAARPTKAVAVAKTAAGSKSTAPRAAAADVAANGKTTAILALQSRESLIRDGRNAAGGALFNRQSWTPPPPPPLKPSEMPPPVAPPLPFAYLGKKFEDGAWEVYLARGDKTVIVRPQSVIEGQYRVERIVPPTLSLTYLPLNQVQRLTIGGTD